jgi:hypothetical protein
MDETVQDGDGSQEGNSAKQGRIRSKDVARMADDDTGLCWNKDANSVRTMPKCKDVEGAPT